MVIGNCCGPNDSTDKFADAAQVFVKSILEAINKIRGDDGAEESGGPPLVVVTKKVTTYEFDAEAVAKAFSTGFAGVLSALRSGEKLGPGPSFCPTCATFVGPGPRVARPSHKSPLDFSSLEDETGKLRINEIREALERLVDSGPEDENAPMCYARCMKAVMDYVDEKHHDQLRSELVKIITARKGKEPTITPPPPEPVAKPEPPKA